MCVVKLHNANIAIDLEKRNFMGTKITHYMVFFIKNNVFDKSIIQNCWWYG